MSKDAAKRVDLMRYRKGVSDLLSDLGSKKNNKDKSIKLTMAERRQ
jgi:hypothetical protein